MEDVVEPGQTFDLVCSFEVIEHIETTSPPSPAGSSGSARVAGCPAVHPRLRRPLRPQRRHGRPLHRYDPAEFGPLLRAAGLVDEQVVLYNARLGNVLEKARNVIGARRLRKAGKPVPKGAPTGVDAVSMAELAAGSGRLFQPPGSADIAVQYATAPFRLLQHQLPNRSTGLGALARRPPRSLRPVPADGAPGTSERTPHAAVRLSRRSG